MESDQLTQLTASAFAAINPSLLEGFGVPVLEAFNCDIPVLVSNAFSLPEVAGPGAYLFNPMDEESIAQRMTESIDDPNRTLRIDQGRVHKNLFDWKKSAEHIYQFMKGNLKI